MSEAPAGAGAAEPGSLRLDLNAAAVGAARGLGLAASPTFVVMALVTSVDGGVSSLMVCPAAPNASPLRGMALMYLMMSLFHLPPWLRLIVGPRTKRARVTSAGGEVRARASPADAEEARRA